MPPKIKQKAARLINHPYTDTAIITLILISIVVVIFESILDYNNPWHPILLMLDLIIIGIFIVELSIRYYITPRKSTFFKKYWIDIIAIVPLFRSFRLLRILRLLRIFRMGFLINRRISRFSHFFSETYREYYVIGIVVLVILLAGSISIYLIESESVSRDQFFTDFISSVWWTVYTLVAGEMGPAEPKTLAGRVITLLVMLSGLTLFAMFTGIVSAAMVQKLKLQLEDRMLEIEDLENHVIICGWNRQGKSIVEEFHAEKGGRKNCIVIIAELDTAPQFDLKIVQREMIFFIKADYTNVEVLKTARAEKAERAIILADKSKDRSDQDRDARTVLTALTIEKLNPKIFTCAELLNRDNEVHLRMAGVEEVIVGDEYVANVLAAASRNRGIMQVVNELFTSKYGNEFHKFQSPDSFEGQTFIEISEYLKHKHDAILLAIDRYYKEPEDKSKDHIVFVNPPATFRVRQGDYLIIISKEGIQNFGA